MRGRYRCHRSHNTAQLSRSVQQYVNGALGGHYQVRLVALGLSLEFSGDQKCRVQAGPKVHRGLEGAIPIAGEDGHAAAGVRRKRYIWLPVVVEVADDDTVPLLIRSGYQSRRLERPVAISQQNIEAVLFGRYHHVGMAVPLKSATAICDCKLAFISYTFGLRKTPLPAFMRVTR